MAIIEVDTMKNAIVKYIICGVIGASFGFYQGCEYGKKTAYKDLTDALMGTKTIEKKYQRRDLQKDYNYEALRKYLENGK